MLTQKTLEKVRTWGGWYQHIEIYLDGERIGRIQRKRRPKNPNIELLTISEFHGGCVLGADTAWLVRMARNRKEI